MNTMLKTVIASALALGATSAFAALPDPITGSSDLVLVVQNNTTQATYVLDTGITIGSMIGGYTANATAATNTWNGKSGNVAATSGLATFLSGTAATGYSWGIQAAQLTPAAGGSANNNTALNAGQAVALYTSAGGTATPDFVEFQTLQNLSDYVNNTHQSLTQGGALAPLAGAKEGSGANYSAADQQKYGLFFVNDLSAVGTASELFGVTGNGDGSVQSYNTGTVLLQADGTLVFNGNGTTPPPVPLPAAVWLFGSGLMGLVGVSRRRKAAAAV